MREPGSSRFGPYRLVRFLGAGGMGRVSLAVRDGSDAICVLKTLLDSEVAVEDSVQRFLREAQVAALIDHPNIARVFDAGTHDHQLYIAMEYVEGKELFDFLGLLVRRGSTVPVPIALSIALDVLDGLVAVHELVLPDGRRADLVHRDLSPRNVIVGFDGFPRIIDFGLARARIGDYRTRPELPVGGTPRYLAPEQAMGQPADARTDLYTLSAWLHEMLSGRWLVPMCPMFEALQHVVRTPAPLVSALNPGVPPSISEVIAKGLAKYPDDRWPTARAYWAALAHAARETTLARPAEVGGYVRAMFPDALGAVEAIRAEVPTAFFGVRDLMMPTRTAERPRPAAAPDESSTPVIPWSPPTAVVTSAATVSLTSEPLEETYIAPTTIRSEAPDTAPDTAPIAAFPSRPGEWTAQDTLPVASLTGRAPLRPRIRPPRLIEWGIAIALAGSGGAALIWSLVLRGADPAEVTSVPAAPATPAGPLRAVGADQPEPAVEAEPVPPPPAPEKAPSPAVRRRSAATEVETAVVTEAPAPAPKVEIEARLDRLIARVDDLRTRFPEGSPARAEIELLLSELLVRRASPRSAGVEDRARAIEERLARIARDER